MNRLLLLLLLAGVAAWWWLAPPKPDPLAASPAPAQGNGAGAPRLQPTPAAPVAPAAPESTALASLITGYLRDGTADERDHALRTLLPRMIALDPAAAARLALAWEPGLRRTELLGAVARHWAEADLAAALAWLITLPDAADRAVAATATTTWLAQSDPATAVEIGQWLGAGTADGSLERTVQLWSEEHPAEAIDWITRQPAHPARDRLLTRIAHVRAQQNPVEAAALVLRHLPAGAVQDEALVTVVRHWAARDADAADAWVTAFPAGPLHDRAAAEVTRARRLR